MLLKSQMPEFLTRIEKIGSVSFGYHLFAAQDYAVDDIREFVTTIQKQHSGFYIMLQTDGLKINFIASVDK